MSGHSLLQINYGINNLINTIMEAN